MLLKFENVHYAYENALSPIIESATIHFTQGWTGIIGANGSGKTTLLKLAMGELNPVQGQVLRRGEVAYCPQRTDDPPVLLLEFLASMHSNACELKSRLGIQDDWLEEWNRLSHGERKRVQIAVALWQTPDILAIDEPTNHIDRNARDLLLHALQDYTGIGLLVSHDRDLLDTLCRQCVLMDPPDIMVCSGGYTQASQSFQEKETRTLKTHQQIKSQLTRLEKEVHRRKQTAERMRRNSSKRHLAPGDSDARSKIDLARVSGKDAHMTQLARQLYGRINQQEQQLSAIKIKPRYNTEFWFQVNPARMDYLLRMPAGYTELGDGRVLEYPELCITPQDRVAITGANGTGKSTLVRKICHELKLKPDQVIYLPQEIDMLQTNQIMQEVHSLSEENLGHLMTLVSCLGSRPGRLMINQDVSPGEIRKILLARGVLHHPYLIIMDEPTNHLDLPAIECLESALSGCPCALILVSHDERFLSGLVSYRWEINGIPGTNRLCVDKKAL